MVRFLLGCGFGFLVATVIYAERRPAAAQRSRLVRDPAHERYLGRDPEDRCVPSESIREKMMDKTLADSYPASDPPSSIPDPGADDSMVA